MRTTRIAPPKIIHKGKRSQVYKSWKDASKKASKSPDKVYDYCILTPTFNRSELLEAVVAQLQAEAKEKSFRVVHCIVDDGSDQRHHPYASLVKAWAKPGYHFVLERNAKNLGRRQFWKTWNVLLRMIKSEGWKYAIAMPDDHTLCKDFLSRVRAEFERLIQKADVQAVAMNILVQSQRNWQRNRFVDGAFICRRMFFDCLKWKVHPVEAPWFDSPRAQERQCKSKNPISSGVGKQMTDRLAVHNRYRIARVRNVSFLTPMRTQSVMFPPAKYPRRPRNWGLSRSNFIDNDDRVSSFPKGAAK